MNNIIPHSDEGGEKIDISAEEEENSSDMSPDVFSDNEEDQLPSDVMELISDAHSNLQHGKSKALYNNTYKKFMDWKEERKIQTDICENILMGYVNYLCRQKIKPSTLWSNYSMLKNTINLYHNIDISKYTKLKVFLKNKNKGHVKKKSKVFSSVEVNRFITGADDDTWLAVKVALIIGMCGAYRRGELWTMTMDDIKDEARCLIITIPQSKSKTNKKRQFAINGSYYDTIKKYITLRPEDYRSPKFFLQYQNGKCSRQHMAIHNLGAMPKKIATFLKLPSPELYTGHGFRRSSSTIYVNSGADITDLKRLGRWTSNTVAEGYIEESETRQKQVAAQIINAITASNNTAGPSNTRMPPKRMERPPVATTTIGSGDNKENDKPTNTITTLAAPSSTIKT